MGQVESRSENGVERRPPEPVPKEIHGPDRPAEIAENGPFFERRNLRRRKPVFPRRRKQKIFIDGVEAGELEKKVLEIDADAGFLFEKRAEIEADAHLE